MASDDLDTVTIFGKPINLEQEWQKVATDLASLCDGNRYIEYDKEIARLKVKLLHLQEEVDGYKVDNKNLSSVNDDLVGRVKSLISMQDSQLEQYSTALVLLTEERRDLRHTLTMLQKRMKTFEGRSAKCMCRGDVEVKDSGDETDSVGSSQDAGTNTEDTVEVASRIRRTLAEEIVSENEETGVAVPLRDQEIPTIKVDERRLESLESSMESHQSDRLITTAATPGKTVGGSFVNSMIQKLEKKHKLRSFDEGRRRRNEDTESLGGLSNVSDRNADAESLSGKSDGANSVESTASLSEQSLEGVDALKVRVAELEQEVIDLKDTCQSLSGMLERTYDEMLPSTLQTLDDAKDQLIACLRSRLFEAILDLMKVEKGRSNVKSVACGSSLPRAPKTAEVPISAANSGARLGITQSEPAVSPSRSKAAKLLSSPASKLRALREDHYNKLKKFACWNPKSAQDSA